MRAVLAVLAALPLAAPPAHATGVVNTNLAFTYQKLGTGYVGELLCEAAAAGVTTLDAPVATTVECDLAGTKVVASAPGPRAYAVSVSVVMVPFDICVRATAIFAEVPSLARHSVSNGFCRTITTL